MLLDLGLLNCLLYVWRFNTHCPLCLGPFLDHKHGMGTLATVPTSKRIGSRNISLVYYTSSSTRKSRDYAMIEATSSGVSMKKFATSNMASVRDATGC